VSIPVNEKAIITYQIILGITGSAIDSKEGEAVSNIIESEQRVLEFRKFEIRSARQLRIKKNTNRSPSNLF
jgi:hypothetical protein